MLVVPQALLSIASATSSEVIVVVVTEGCLVDKVALKLLVVRWMEALEFSSLPLILEITLA